MYQNYIKRVIDFLLSLVIVIVLSPLYILVFVIVLIALGWPVLFIQERITLHEKPFNIIKFRTMRLERDKTGRYLSMDERNNSIGNLLRSLSIDELPEMFNILKGDLSFVGPRPLYEEYLAFYTDEEKKTT